MSVTGLGRIAMAEKMSVDQLKEALQNKSLPAYIAYPLIAEKEDMAARAQNAAAMAQAQQNQPTIGEEIMARSGPGIDALQTNLAPAEGMAGGGIVAFEDGGYVEPIRFQNQGLVPSQEEIDREAMMDTIRRMKAAGMDLGTLPVRGVAGAFESAVTRPLRAAGLPIPYLPSSFYGGNPASMTPYFDAIRKEDEAKKAATPVKPDATIPASATAAPPAPPASPAPPAGAAPGIEAAPTRGFMAPPPSTAIEDTKALLEGAPGADGGIGGYFARSEEREKRLMDALGKDRLQGKAFEGYEKMLQKDAEQAGIDKSQAKYMSLLKAGLAMMAGTSRHALENIGKGAMVGAADYQEAYKDLRKAERERTKEFALIEQARRAEAQNDLKRRDELLVRASEAAQKRDDFGTNALLNAGIEKRRDARETWRTQYAGEKTLEAARISAAGRGQAGITPYQLSQIRKDAMATITPEAIRAQVAEQRKIKAPKPGVDKTFDDMVNAAYEKAINSYVSQRLGIGQSQGGVSGFSLVGSED